MSKVMRLLLTFRLCLRLDSFLNVVVWVLLCAGPTRIMVRVHKKKVGARNYKNYTEETLQQALSDIRSGRLSQKAASEKYKINRTTLLYKINRNNEGKPGHPTVLTEEEKLISDTLGTVSDWGFPMSKSDIRSVIEKSVNKQGRNVPQWKDGVPGYDFIEAFATRNNLSTRIATNIKRQRAAIGAPEITEYFNNLREVLSEARASEIFNYDETNITDDPGAKKVLVPRGRK